MADRRRLPLIPARVRLRQAALARHRQVLVRAGETLIEVRDERDLYRAQLAAVVDVLDQAHHQIDADGVCTADLALAVVRPDVLADIRAGRQETQ